MITLEPQRTALLLMDLQSDVVNMLGDKGAAVVARAAELAAAARQANVPVIYVVVSFRPGYPELNRRSLWYAALGQSGRFVAGTPGVEVVPALRPEEGDLVVVKRRVNAFAGTDLEVILRAKGIDTLILVGLSTSGVILSTARHGFDADYQLVLVKDGCADADDEVHRVLTEKVLARQARVIAASEAIAALRPA
jgi:nicotinamidase-related amidase